MAETLRKIEPYTQQYRFVVGPEYVGIKILDFYCHRFSFKPRDYWQKLLLDGDISVNCQGIDDEYMLQEGDILHTYRRDVQEPDVNDQYQVIYDKDDILVINKPAPLPVHPVGRYFKNSLIHILQESKPQMTYHTIHRLDVWTTGVLILATESIKARLLHLQVEKKQMQKVYGVLAVGDFGREPFVIDEAVGRIEGAHRGIGPKIKDAKESKTIFTPLAKNGEIQLLKAEPLTGRTNQIRVHLQAKGGHILNDLLYSPSPDKNANFMGLHCRQMKFRLSSDDEPVSFTADWPKHFLDYFSLSQLKECEYVA